ncbi:hypothetical protein STSP2_02664 [Anaerohalosphaera lusitana]|uniref:Uncharacterized protein n=1 Tax=Anaerohalosphaera lusitana TaxID=1936003 RepID=A0A1U9NNJ4_9BACT|nr:hypothetical protein [Anaerohalosphaera lusitana]AQT69473.1 hypothetical protein STSP2_02664 [Anaerohalosphaera lusitana]
MIKAEELEKYSSAITLSDMEIFVYPELMYSLVLANIMSPILWKWRKLETFEKIKNKTPYRRFMRMRQFIMDEYDFNLDLETWGLTHKDVELERFKDTIDPRDIAQSNALFGYTGDKYYFDVEIRKHFGLDKYDSEIIPYWKTETLEAMDAFQYKPGYDKKAGECVSLAALYAAAAFVVCDIPLEDIYMILTPLHSQNYVDVNGGVITNNRRIVTKSMWFNGTEISMKAQRAMKNEQITIVAHSTGHVHCFYDDATIDPKAYEGFKNRLDDYLTEQFDLLTFSNFLRAYHDYQKYFQYCRELRGQKKFIDADVLFRYEHGSNYRIADQTFDKLLEEVSDEDFTPYKRLDRMCSEQLRAFVEYEQIDVFDPEGQAKLKDYLSTLLPDVDAFMEDMTDFLKTEPRLPSGDKKFHETEPVKISPEQSREEIIDYLQGLRSSNKMVDLAFYAYRDMETCDWVPFARAAIERNPVSIETAKDISTEKLVKWLGPMVNESIYQGKRIAQPDEVVNYQRGDGAEKAFALANILHERGHEDDITVTIDGHDVTVECDKVYRFVSSKELRGTVRIKPDGKIEAQSL